MITLNWSIGVLIIAPFVAFIISLLGMFDIKKDSADKLFKECLKKLRNEKVKIWKKLLIIRRESLTEEEFNDQLTKILEDEERYIKLSTLLQRCRKYFDFYYMTLLFLFSAGVLIGMSTFIFPTFYTKELATTFLSVTAIISLLFIVIGIVVLVIKKKTLDKLFDDIISSSTPIKL